MTYETELSKLGVYDTRAPRYTSYPTAVHFGNHVGPDFTKKQLQNLPIDQPVSIYIHIPFCERLCWFCACRTQGTKSVSSIKAYLDTLVKEIAMISDELPKGVKVAKIHWGGGTPTILSPDQIRRLAITLKDAIPHTEDVEFSVEIDPTLIDPDKVQALVEMGMSRASIGVQDFAVKVQKAIGRQQSYDATKECIQLLRDANINSLNMDILYGLPHQTDRSVLETINKVLSLSPDRIALYGYAHVPWMAKRQKLINEIDLPNGKMRRELFNLMASELENNDYAAIGIDHFAKASDLMAISKNDGTLRRNFQGYTTDAQNTLIGIGASAISKYPDGYVQNISKSSDYSRAVQNHMLPTYRGIEMTDDDRLIARIIEMIMCDFEVDYSKLMDEFENDLDSIMEPIAELHRRFNAILEITENGFKIIRHKRELARIIAQSFDKYDQSTARYSSVS